ncbi:MAG: alanine racemase [Oscillospiraceae bacterium]|nr:alanine racemase [Oscillospiraceae bacterium]
MSFHSNIDGRIWADIDLNALEHNALRVKEILGDVKHMAVIKANAYGHGALQTARRLECCGADYFAVACLSEALELRHNDIKTPILVMGYTPAEHADMLAELDITQAVFDTEYAEALSKNLSRELKIHIKVDTGMNRLGVKTAREVREIARLKHLRPEGLYTHLADADTPGGAFVSKQLEAFNSIKADLIDIKFPITHCANSGGVLYYRESLFDMARSGILLFGADGDFRPVMRLRARIAQIIDVRKGDTVSYGRTFTAGRGMKAAVVCAGYADGYLRSLSNKGVADYNGVIVPVIGRVCMDMLMLDVSDADRAKVGDSVTLFGSEKLSAARLAELAGTISYELLCAVSDRVPRFYD